MYSKTVNVTHKMLFSIKDIVLYNLEINGAQNFDKSGTLPRLVFLTCPVFFRHGSVKSETANSN